MTPLVLFTPDAARGVREARLWYDRRAPKLGLAFALEIHGAIGRILANPLAYPFMRGGTRRSVLHRFPHAVHFRIHNDHIIVLAVLRAR